jgi:hypothetical protein
MKFELFPAERVTAPNFEVTDSFGNNLEQTFSFPTLGNDFRGFLLK